MQQPRVLDGDDRLCGKVLRQFDLFVRKETRVLAVDAKDANKLIVLEQRHAEQGLRAPVFGQWSFRRLNREVNHLLGCRNTVQGGGVRQRDVRVLLVEFDERGRRVVQGDQTKSITLAQR